MAPIVDIAEKDFERAKQILTLSNVDYSTPKQEVKNEDFEYVPALKLWVAKKRTLQGTNWFDAHKLLQSQGNRMLTLPEFVKYLKYAQSESPAVYEDITAVRNPWRAEWIDADFKVIEGKLSANSGHVYKKEGLVPQVSEVLDSETLMQDRAPGISLDSWLKNPTKQGLPRKDVAKGNLYYWYPRSDNNSVARFYAFSVRADVYCNRGPSGGGAGLGVRAVKLD